MLITIITPVGPGKQSFFRDTAYSVSEAILEAKRKHDDLDVQWVISSGKKCDLNHFAWVIRDIFQVQPDIITVGEKVSPEKVVTIIYGDHVSPASTGRNLAALASRESWLANLDADDIFLGNKIVNIVENIREGYDYLLSSAHDLVLENDYYVEKKYASISSRKLSPGWFDELVEKPDGSYGLPVHMSSLVIRRKDLILLGGYPSVPYCEDTVLAYHISNSSMTGYHDSTVTWCYRHHPGQITRNDYDAESIIRSWVELG